MPFLSCYYQTSFYHRMMQMTTMMTMVVVTSTSGSNSKKFLFLMGDFSPTNRVMKYVTPTIVPGLKSTMNSSSVRPKAGSGSSLSSSSSTTSTKRRKDESSWMIPRLLRLEYMDDSKAAALGIHG
mmetsp:Transcript_47924/g.116570  ORF Transcript_47924/g.116570 Transcript_47924/m.116570 type:complete len:125 (+) Transcript_47924:2675-3049(+)